MTYLNECSRTCLTQSIRLLGLNAQSLVYCFNEISRQGSGSRSDDFERLQVVRIYKWVFGKMENDGWRNVRVGNLLILNNLAKAFEVKRLHDMSCEARIRREVYEALET